MELPRTSLDIWGTASPIKEIGPQKAVAVAVKTPVQTKIEILAGLIFTPKFAAYISPSRRALSGFMSSSAQASPTKIKS